MVQFVRIFYIGAVISALSLVPITGMAQDKKVIPPKEKKPRTEKQLAAFEKMRSARASKQNELNDLKELEKTQRQLENEQRKLDTVTEKVLAKATELKTKRVSKKKVVVEDDGYRTEPESIIREQKHKPIVFM